MRNRNFVQTGERNHSAKLNTEKVREIRKMLAEGKSQRSIGRAFGVSSALIGMVARRQVWAHVDSEQP